MVGGEEAGLDPAEEEAVPIVGRLAHVEGLEGQLEGAFDEIRRRIVARLVDQPLQRGKTRFPEDLQLRGTDDVVDDDDGHLRGNVGPNRVDWQIDTSYVRF